MNDNLLEYHQVLNFCTAQTMEEEQYSNREDAFTHYILSQIATKVASENFVVCHASLKNTIGSYIGEIFAYNESPNEEVLTLFYTIYDATRSDAINVLTDTDIQYAWNRMQGFYDYAVRFNIDMIYEDDPAYEICHLIKENNDKYKIIRFYILSNCNIKKSEPKKLRIHDKETDTNIWDLKKLAGNLTDISDHVEINIKFDKDGDYNYTIPYIQMETANESNYRCLLMMFPAKLLYKLYKKWNTDLLLYNVRYWLTFKKSKRKHTNADIRDTLRNQPEMFLAYNNGITAIASDVELEPHGDSTMVSESEDEAKSLVTSGILKAITNFQIVNGGQTTASIFKAKEAEPQMIDLMSTFVQVKLIVISEKQNAAELASKISRSSNTQNAVKDSDFSVSEQFNTRMQELSKKVRVPNEKDELTYWFYERVRGQYEEEKSRIKHKDERDAFLTKYPKKFMFTKELMAIVRKSWDQVPCDAVKGAGTAYDIFISEIISNNYIPDESYFRETAALIMMHNFLKARPENKTYGNAKAPVAAYTIAYISYACLESNPLLHIWFKQIFSDKQQKAMDRTANRVYQLLSKMAEEQDGNTILSLSKRKDTFREMVRKMTGDDIYNARMILDED